MKSAVLLSGKDSLRLWNYPTILSLRRRLPPQFQTTTPNNSPLHVLGLRCFRCLHSVAFAWHCSISWSIFGKAGQRKACGKAPEAFRRQLGCGIPRLDSLNMSGRQRRVRKETVTTAETTLELSTVQNGLKCVSESSPTEVEKLHKENFEVDSWQFQLLERHEANNLNSYTVTELRQLLREMKKQPKGQKSDLLKAVKSWLFERTPPSGEREDDESAKLLEAVESNPKSNRKRRKKTGTPVVVFEGQAVETLIVKKPKATKKAATESAVGHEEPWTVLVHKRPEVEWCAYNPKTMRPPNPGVDSQPEERKKVVKLLSWNVNGLRALLKEKGVQHEQGSVIARLAEREDFDVLCLQETKLQEKDVEDIRKSLLASHEESLWSCSISKLGYSGTAIISRIKPVSVCYGLGVPVHDKEGRLITCEFDSFYFVVCYVPNSGAKLERLAYRTQEWDIALSGYLKELEKKKPVILTGDLNCAHEEIDIHDPAGNKKSAGFTDEERKSFQTNFLGNGFVDTFRKQHPHAVAYTYWGYRTVARPKNRGWRLDYFLVSESLFKDVVDSYTIPDVGGSDHCPIGLIMRT